MLLVKRVMRQKFMASLGGGRALCPGRSGRLPRVLARSLKRDKTYFHSEPSTLERISVERMPIICDSLTPHHHFTLGSRGGRDDREMEPSERVGSRSVRSVLGAS